MTFPNFNPPTSREGKPNVPVWQPPPTTKCDLDWAQLRAIDLSLMNSNDPAVVAQLVETTKAAMREDGFLYVENYGISESQLQRQFDLAQYTHTHLSDADKKRLLWDPSQGTFAGYKPGRGWKREPGEIDGIEHFNWYRPQFRDEKNLVPTHILPFMDEIRAFSTYMTESVVKRLLILLSRAMEMPDTYLYDTLLTHDDTPVGDGYFRHAMYYALPEHIRKEREQVRMFGHADFSVITLLYSIPVIALHIWGRDEKWHPVKYHPGALVVNVGQAVEIVSGGHFKATLHKVSDIPPDQVHLDRLGIMQFANPAGHLRLEPCMQSPLLQREGLKTEGEGVFVQFKRRIDSGMPVPTQKEWREDQIANRAMVPPAQRTGGVQEINGVKYGVDEFNGVKVVHPV